MELGKKYYAAVEKMQQFSKRSHSESYREAEEEKNRLGEKLDFIHAIMETVIRSALGFLKARYPEGGENIRYWLDAVREIEKEDKGG